MPRLTGWLRPLVDAVARIDASIHRKLLSGFLAGALLLVGMAVLSLVVIGRMNERVGDLDHLQEKASRAQQMLYAVTAQSHFRAMALLTGDDRYNAQIADEKTKFIDLLNQMERADPDEAPFFQQVRATDASFAESSGRALALYNAGDIPGATRLHLDEEHPASHVLEAAMRRLIGEADEEMVRAQAAFESDRTLLAAIVVAFSATSVIAALILGFVLSWPIIIPVRRMQRALAAITSGDFTQRVEVPNRDEFGSLARDLNDTSERLAQLFEDQRALSRRLESTNTSLAAASEAKSRFLASVSHELRTPMNAILGFTDELLAGGDGPLNDDQRASLGWVQRGGRELLALINEILDLSKIEAGRVVVDPQPIDPRGLVESTVLQYRTLAAQKGIAFGWHDVGAPEQVTLDPQLTRQILVNLIGNALKFTSVGEVVVEVGGADASMLTVAVRDSGPGIRADQHETIFEEFHQVRGATEGTGLGLAISRRLARLMGGDITVESEPGHGSVFLLTLPLEQPVALAAATSAQPSATSDGAAVLLSVDDDPSVAPLLEKMLVGQGYRVVAANPSSAVSDARRLKPAAILLDLLMPGHDGRDILRALKGDPETRGIPVIVVTVVDRAEMPDLADGHLTKPVTKHALLRMLGQRHADGRMQR